MFWFYYLVYGIIFALSLFVVIRSSPDYAIALQNLIKSSALKSLEKKKKDWNVLVKEKESFEKQLSEARELLAKIKHSVKEEDILYKKILEKHIEDFEVRMLHIREKTKIFNKMLQDEEDELSDKKAPSTDGSSKLHYLVMMVIISWPIILCYFSVLLYQNRKTE